MEKNVCRCLNRQNQRELSAMMWKIQLDSRHEDWQNGGYYAVD